MMAIDLLDYQNKEAFILSKFEGMKRSEIADICGISVDGVKKRLSRARNKILEILDPYIKDLKS